MSNYDDFMIDFDCPVCGDSADERGCINKCDIDVYIDSIADGSVDPFGYAGVPEDAAMEAGLFGWDA